MINLIIGNEAVHNIDCTDINDLVNSILKYNVNSLDTVRKNNGNIEICMTKSVPEINSSALTAVSDILLCGIINGSTYTLTFIWDVRKGKVSKIKFSVNNNYYAHSINSTLCYLKLFESMLENDANSVADSLSEYCNISKNGKYLELDIEKIEDAYRSCVIKLGSLEIVHEDKKKKINEDLGEVLNKDLDTEELDIDYDVTAHLVELDSLNNFNLHGKVYTDKLISLKDKKYVIMEETAAEELRDYILNDIKEIVDTELMDSLLDIKEIKKYNSAGYTEIMCMAVYNDGSVRVSNLYRIRVYNN